MPLGLYISVPFCRTKCTYCNFASDVFSRPRFEKYVERLCAEIQSAPQTARHIGSAFDRNADSIYFGGGTPTLLDPTQLRRIFVTIRQNFELQPGAEITVECAPGTLSDAMLAALVDNGVNRVSLGVQSFIDHEAASVGRLHNRATVFADSARLRAAGITNINIDLIAGLPHQTRASWEQSLSELIALGTPHASIYMLEVDEDSRLGRELIAGGQKYHAHFVPDADLIADLYEIACDRLNRAGIAQYEISNFARPGFESRHNLKYWTRQPYFGFGVDAHSFLPVQRQQAIRFANPDSLDKYVSSAPLTFTPISVNQAFEEIFFLGLRLNRGVDLQSVAADFGLQINHVAPIVDGLIRDGLLTKDGSVLRLTDKGRVLSNEVFAKFIADELQPASSSHSDRA